MIENQKFKSPKKYETILLNNIGLDHYNCINIKFGVLLHASNKEKLMILEYDCMKDLKVHLEITKTEFN